MRSPLIKIRSEILAEAPGISHGFFGDWHTSPPGKLDEATQFEAQLNAIATELQVEQRTMVAVDQIHSAKVRTVGAQWSLGPPKADAMVSDRPGISLILKTADCAPVLLYDADAGVIGAAHAGWRGALAGVLTQTILNMTFLGAQRERILASIGPCIGQENYEVSTGFLDDFLDTSPQYSNFFTQEAGQKPHFDLSAFCADQIRQAGVSSLATSPLDTFEKKNQFFSYRRAHRDSESGYGRNISIIHLAKS